MTACSSQRPDDLVSASWLGRPQRDHTGMRRPRAQRTDWQTATSASRPPRRRRKEGLQAGCPSEPAIPPGEILLEEILELALAWSGLTPDTPAAKFGGTPMTRLRRALGRIAITWLLCHVTTLTLAQTVLWSRAGEELLECTCTHGDHAICPMHHKPAPGSTLCLMQSADDDGPAILTSIFGIAGLLPAPTRAATPEPQRAGVLIEIETPSARPAPPDPPPPRL